MTTSPQAYRADIDGLRALAVLPVVAFHAGVSGIPGGFVGVDVFLVISGFLITAILAREIERGEFSLWRFYDRRIRRIVPALITMFAAVWLVGALVLYPPEMRLLGESMAAALLSVANLYFWQTINYFNPGDTVLLLHTWSLGVEEQFYLVFPLLLAWLHRRGQAPLRLLLIVLALSLVASSIGVFHWRSATFYLLPTRAWELLVGACLALWRPSFRIAPLLRQAMGAAGLALILFAMLHFNKDGAFPGLRALFPCVGAALIILAGSPGGSSLVNQLLSTRPLVFIGLISYSLYLWHWPVMVFQNTAALFFPDTTPAALVQVGVIVLSIVLATASWWFIERPFRGAWGLSRRTAMGLAGGGTAVALTMSGVAAALPQSFPTHGDASVAVVASYLDYPQDAGTRVGTCFLLPEDRQEQFDPATCLRSDPARKNYLLVGDSHAAHLLPGLTRAWPQANIMQATAAGCLPVVGWQTGISSCVRFMRDTFDQRLWAQPVDAVLLSARWSEHSLDEASRTLAWLQRKGMRTIVFGPVPRYDMAVPRLLANAVRSGDPDLLRRHMDPGLDRLDRQMADLAHRHGARYISVFRSLCASGQCLSQTPELIPMQYDRSHLTIEGSELLVRQWLRSGVLGP
ncbi:peptidoglycan/LPS O-acetylase OafA/YrhL [Sphaerotilus hippei]|uniref:Peptidoglycan/LPS O-acetylase OafA/YrhL n=1 Tax=Sphaerotilus hippei TaxID=744406 RepID=A0A318GX89_9BURK|nr:acyltransferase family protein [Sphaerotilus hippei]PXW92405.1 peptidoglycan/LPS O-acetylase OafA/YrhL [Sphaerotilus hippei]